jgi:hypothetical protein
MRITESAASEVQAFSFQFLKDGRPFARAAEPLPKA